MTEKDKLSLIYRIVSGYTIIDDFIVRCPSDTLLNESICVYQEALRKYRFDGFLARAQTEWVLVKNNLWKTENNNILKELDKTLDACKLSLYQHYGMPESQTKVLRNQIEQIKKKQSELINVKHSLDTYTLEGYAEYLAEVHVFSKSLLNKDYKPIETLPQSLEQIINKYKSHWPSNTQLRLIARTEPWRSFWTTNPKCFRVFGDEQKMLSIFSKMYDNVYEHSEKPCDEIINDDDMLDGWFVYIRKQNKEKEKDTTKNILAKKHPNSQEIFVVSNSEKDVDDINNMNDLRGKLVQKRINAGIRQKDFITDKDIPELHMGMK